MPSSEQSQSPRELIAGVPCDFLSLEEYIQTLQTALTQQELTHIITLNAEMVVLAQKDSDFKKAIQHAELVIPDSSAILWAREYISPPHMRGSERGSIVHVVASLLSFLFSKQKPLTGVDSIFLICTELEKKNGTAYLLGGEENDREKTAELLQQKYPKLVVKTLDDKISRLQPTTYNLPSSNAIFVALGAPKQTFWIDEHRTELERAGIRIAIGVGGAFAMISGRLPRAPQWMRTAHLEWLWRLLLEPQRMKRIWNAVIMFPYLVSLQKKKARATA